MTKVLIIYSVYGSRLESQCYPGTSWYQILVIDLIGQLSHNDIGHFDVIGYEESVKCKLATLHIH